MAVTVKEVICNGIWINNNDELYVSISDILDELGLEHTDENKSIVEAKVQELMRELVPNVKFIAVGACPNCGIGDGEPHKPGCALRGE